MQSTAFVTAVQHRTARVSVGASTTRGQGPGVVAAGREFLANLPLASFVVTEEAAFIKRLDAETLRLRDALPVTGRSWGLARKLLNIFLRDALYTTYLSEAYQICRIESYLETPLDPISANALQERAQSRKLPRWPGVKHLTREVSDAYQSFAATLAAQCGYSRAHLDTYWWGQRVEHDVA